MTDALKEMLEAIYELGDTLDEGPLGLTARDSSANMRSALNSELMLYLLHLAMLDGTIDWEEADFIHELLGIKASVSDLSRLAMDQNVGAGRFVKEIPLSFRIFGKADKALHDLKGKQEAKASELLFLFYQQLGKEFLLCADELSENTIKQFKEYLEKLSDYIETKQGISMEGKRLFDSDDVNEYWDNVLESKAKRKKRQTGHRSSSKSPSGRNLNAKRRTNDFKKEDVEEIIIEDEDADLPLVEKLQKHLSQQWAGSADDVRMIVNAFMHYFVNDAVRHPKTNIMMLGSDSRGKLSACFTMGRLLKEEELIDDYHVAVLNMKSYVGQEFIIFLSDLYRALYQDNRIVVFDNIESADVKQLDAIYQLMSQGVYHLERRYIDRGNDTLIDATGVLSPDIISEFYSNEKILVLTSTMKQAVVTDQIGNQISAHITDIVPIAPLETDEISHLVDLICMNVSEKCKKDIELIVNFDDSFKEKLRKLFSREDGAKGIYQYCIDRVYSPLIEASLNGNIKKLYEIDIKIDQEDRIDVYKDGKVVCNLDQFVKQYNRVELEQVQKELASVIGLASVKEYIYSLENNLKVQRLRKSQGLKTANISMHMIFTGNPGTGKTTIARLVAKYLKAIGVLSNGQLREVTRADLVGKYVGHTAPQVMAAIQSALGGVLFIDEAYSLCQGENDSFGKEAVDALVKGMEDNKDNLVVILAGYDKEMEEFLKANPGLKSRFPNVIHFDDYTQNEMYKIAEVTAASKGYKIADECYEPLIEEFERHQIKGRNDGGNGRLVRNMIETAILRQSKRIAMDSTQDLELLTLSDFALNERRPYDLEGELSKIIGLDSVKKFIRDQYKMQKAAKLQKKQGIELDNTQSLNMIFAGNPGTGKTTMARVVADMFHELGILKSGQLIEADAKDLIAQYVGHTAKKTEDIFKSALGGVLFIDEAYGITNSGSSFGQEAIDTLVKLIEDFRGEIVVILAGYSKEMKEFMKANSGLESRFPLVIEFPDYSAEELTQIGNKMFEGKGYQLTEQAKEDFAEEMRQQKNVASENAGNGRMARNIVEQIIRRQNVRIVDSEDAAFDVREILPVDIVDPEAKNEIFDLEKELSKIIGLEEVKELVRDQYRMLQVQEKYRKAGIEVDTSQALNMIFTGNPGTGKTTVARVISSMFKSMGLLKKGHIIETDKRGLISEYAGQTAQKTEEVFKSAIGGVLFIDEAYGITNDGSSFGQEAIDTLVKLIEDHKGKIIVILAGYSKEMKDFLKSNSGLESRFPITIDFKDYTAEELIAIGKQMVSERGFTLIDESQASFEDEIRILKKHSNAASGNGRMVRNFIEKIIRAQASRIATSDVSDDELKQLISADIIDEQNKVASYDLDADLAKVIGLDSVKKYVKSLQARLFMQEQRKKAGLKVVGDQTLHMIFTGNPGTGKTTMARTVANVLYNMGVTSTNKVVEVDRSGLVAGYVGQTATKTREVIESALGGVLFIDEAYSLAEGGENDFGKEAIDTLVKMMDDNRERLVVILAGYSNEMKRFLEMNSGLKSRFANVIEFADYSVEELMKIADNFYEEQGYQLTDDAVDELEILFARAKKDSSFGNGRFVRNVMEKTLNSQALRLANGGELTTEQMISICGEDVMAIIPELELDKTKKLGF